MPIIFSGYETISTRRFILDCHSLYEGNLFTPMGNSLSGNVILMGPLSGGLLPYGVASCYPFQKSHPKRVILKCNSKPLTFYMSSAEKLTTLIKALNL